MLGYTESNDYEYLSVSKYASNGVLDSSFGESGHYFYDKNSDNYGGALGIDADGKIVIAARSDVNGSNYDVSYNFV